MTPELLLDHLVYVHIVQHEHHPELCITLVGHLLIITNIVLVQD